MHTGLEIVVSLVSALTVAAVLALFVWAARKDGEDERTRLGR
jgi:hypothetical protein